MDDGCWVVIGREPQQNCRDWADLWEQLDAAFRSLPNDDVYMAFGLSADGFSYVECWQRPIWEANAENAHALRLWSYLVAGP